MTLYNMSKERALREQQRVMLKESVATVYYEGGNKDSFKKAVNNSIRKMSTASKHTTNCRVADALRLVDRLWEELEQENS